MRSPHVLPPPPPDPDEGYWAALLNEGEHAHVSAPEPVEDALDAPAAWGEPPLATHGPAAVGAPLHSDWEALRAICERDDTAEMRVILSNRGGLIVEWRSLRGFVPASQLVDLGPTFDPAARQRALNACVGRMLTLRALELDEAGNRLILSERAARVQPGERADVLKRLQTGDTVRGVITNLCDFGAFVDLGGLEGLIHISEISWGRVGHPADLLRRGETVEAHVMEVNPAAGRVALSLKRLRPDPWQTVHLHYRVGEQITGLVTNVVDFGAFVRLEEGLEGLIHVSELAEGQFLHPRNVVREGEHISARIIAIDGQARRLGLTLRSAGA
jgi:small subunit ribosomal protein S1